MSDAERPNAARRAMSIDLDTEGQQFLATAESENACLAVYAARGTTDAELRSLLGDVRSDLPEQGRRVGVVDADPTGRWAAETTAEEEGDDR